LLGRSNASSDAAAVCALPVSIGLIAANAAHDFVTLFIF
jgi:hypothetical protein